MKTFLIRYFIGVAILGSLLWLFYAQGYRIITTPSVPPGIWKVESIHGPVRRGQFVWLCPPDTPFFRLAKQRGYIPEGDCPAGYRHLLKPVVAVADDVIALSNQGLAVNGRLLIHSQCEHLDQLGRFLPKLKSNKYRVQKNEVWTVSPYHAKSFDSRYFGAISVKQIEGKAYLVWKF